MSLRSDAFLKNMLKFFPSAYSDYTKSIKQYGEVLETVIIEDIFMPKILELLIENKNKDLLKEIFNCFEEVFNCEDLHTKNILTTTVLEILGNEKRTLDLAQKYMGPKTLQQQSMVDEMLGRE